MDWLQSYHIEQPINVDSQIKITGRQMFVDVMIAGTPLTGIVDTGESFIYISENSARKSGIPVEKGIVMCQTDSSLEYQEGGLALDVEVSIGSWTSKDNIAVIPLDNIDVIIGMGFLDSIEAVIVPFANCICILNSSNPCAVPVKRNGGIQWRPR
jgi:hypothetical protein